MMKQWNRQISLSFLCFLFLLLVPVLQASADSDKETLGEMEWKIDRIVEEESGDNHQNTETELEKSFPDLFKEETTALIQSTQYKKEATLESLKETLFQTNIGENSVISDTRKSLFTANYTAPKMATDENIEDKQSTWWNTALLIALVGVVFVVIGGIFAMVRKLAD